MKICREKPNFIKIQQKVSVTLHEHLTYSRHEIFCVTINIYVLLRVKNQHLCIVESDNNAHKKLLPFYGNNDYANRPKVTL